MLLTVDFSGTGIAVEDLRQGGMVASNRDLLNIQVKIPASWSAYTFSTLPGTPLGYPPSWGSPPLAKVSLILESCMLVLDGGGCGVSAGLSASNQAKKQLRSSASEASVLASFGFLHL